MWFIFHSVFRLGYKTLSWDLNFIVFPITLQYVLDEYPPKVLYQGLVPRVTLGGDIYIFKRKGPVRGTYVPGTVLWKSIMGC